MCMTRAQVLIPDQLHAEAKRIAKEQEMSVSDVVRRGLEHMVRIYPRRVAPLPWQPPAPINLGTILAPVEAWRELANDPSDE
jgi:hypothetical protein